MLLCSSRGELLALVLQVCVVVTSSDEARSRMILLIRNQLQVTMTTNPSRIAGGNDPLTCHPARPDDDCSPSSEEATESGPGGRAGGGALCG